MTTQIRHRPLSSYATEIRARWRNKEGESIINFAAKPYLDAMLTMDQITEPYFADSGTSIVIYFLSNAQTWRGPDARRIKEALKALLVEFS